MKTADKPPSASSRRTTTGTKPSRGAGSQHLTISRRSDIVLNNGIFARSVQKFSLKPFSKGLPPEALCAKRGTCCKPQKSIKKRLYRDCEETSRDTAAFCHDTTLLNRQVYPIKAVNLNVFSARLTAPYCARNQFTASAVPQELLLSENVSDTRLL